MGSNYPGPRGRKRAIALKAADAATLIHSVLPWIVQYLSADQLGQVQKVLDAAVVNPQVQKEYQELMRKSVIAESGGLANRDQGIVAQANRVFEEQIVVGESDKHVRLDYNRLLTPDALRPVTDNPDEAKFLIKIRNTLNIKGVWLRFDQTLIRNPQEFGLWMVDPRTFRAWLSLGYGGDAIPTTNGQLNRGSLLGTTVLGANYYMQVSRGSVQQTLDKAVRKIRDLISEGRSWHQIQQDARSTAKPGVVLVSDFLGGADFPNMKIWDLPSTLVTQSLTANVGGNIKESSTIAMYAGFATKVAADILDEYVDDTQRGAGRAVKILTVVTIAGKIAEAFLVVRTLVVGLIRMAAAEGGVAATEATVETANRTVSRVVKDRSPAAYYPTNYRGVVAYENTINQFATPITESGFGTVVNRNTLLTENAQRSITGWSKDFEEGVKEIYKSKGEAWTGGWAVTREEFTKISTACDSKWGDIMSLFSDLDRLRAGL